jgi:hypothetical protein
VGHTSADGNTLLRQAKLTAEEYFNAAVNSIDHSFGDGYAEKHPELIAAFMQVAASDMNYCTLAKAQSECVEYLADKIESAIDSLADKISVDNA